MIKIRKIYYGWLLVVLTFVIGVYGGATVWYGFTAFYDPLIKEFGWSYTAISLAAALRGAEFGLMDVAIGFLADRVSIRWIILCSSALVGIGWFILSNVNSLGIFFLSFFIICTGSGGIGSVVFLTLLARWFRRRAGLVMGIVVCGFGAGGVALPAIVYLLDLAGFRTAFFIFGVTALVIGGITAYFVRDWPRDIGLSPDGIPPDVEEYVPDHSEVTSSEKVAPSDYTVRRALSQPAFWIITYGIAASVFFMSGVSTHIMPYLEHLGYSRYTASFVAMILPILSFTGRLGTGLISDRVSSRVILIFLTLVQLVSSILFLYSKSLPFLILFVIFFGATYGGFITLRPIALKECFGTANIGSLLGLCMGLSQVGSITGPLLAGWIFDTTGNYSLAWIAAGILFAVSIPLGLIMKKPK